MEVSAQLAVLLWKNLVMMWRSKWWTICEFIFMLLMLPYLIIILKYVPDPTKDDAYSFEPILVSGDSSDFSRQINTSSSINRYYLHCGNQTKKFGYSYEPGSENATRKLMHILEERYDIEIDTGVDMHLQIHIEIESFSSLEKLRKELLADLNQTHAESRKCPEYLGGVHFTNITLKSSGPPKLVYRILLPKFSFSNVDQIKWDLDSFWLKDDPNEPQSDHNQIPSQPPYWQTGFLSLQYAIESTFLETYWLKNGKKNILEYANLSLLRIPIDESLNGGGAGMLLFLKISVVFWVLMLVGIMLHTTKNIVIEKEAGIKSYMSVMGLNPMAFYFSHILIGVLKSTIVMILCTGLLSAALTGISSTLLVFFAIIFGFSMVLLSALISVIVAKPQLAQFISNLLPCLLLGITMSSTPPNIKIGFCFLASLNPCAAFKLGMNHVIKQMTQIQTLGWLSMFDDGTQSFTIGMALLMLIFDCVLFTLIIAYLDAVFPTDDTPKQHPLYFMKTCGFNFFNKRHREMKLLAEDQTDSKVLNENMEPEHTSLDEADIIVQHMSKKWTWRGKLAVDNLNFRAYRGQLTVLLGHNGAGKTTTFSVLTGTINSSAGQVLICGKNLETNLRECQKKIGYCPQNNPLFDQMTVREHLRIYSTLKSGKFGGPYGKIDMIQEINAVVNQVGLTPKMDTEAQKLSGGQKRKLCVAIALIAGSQVVLLDEPTAGMDPEARNQVGKLLERVKQDRTILLTTHYMEEADSLGDRIGIMANGRLMCNGSPEFLKNKFGTGFILSVVCAGFDNSQRGSQEEQMRLFNQTINRILGVVRKYSPNARVEKAQRPPEFTIILPTADKRHYANLFEELENGKILLGISSFGLSLNTLEQVFLKVGELSEPETDPKGGDQVDGVTPQNIAHELFGVRQQQFVNTRMQKLCLWAQQMAAMVYRQFLWIVRNPTRSFLPLFIAVLSFIGIGFFYKSANNNSILEQRSLSLDTVYENIRMPMQIGKSGTQGLIRENFMALSRQICPKCVFAIDPKNDLHTELKKQLRRSPPMAVGMAVYENSSTNQLGIEALFNGAAIHSPPMAISLVTNALLGKEFTIRPNIEIYDVPHDSGDDEIMQTFSILLRKILICFIIIMCFSIFGATMVAPLVEENAGKFKHQLMLTKLHVVTYWASVFVANLIFYAFYCSILLLIFIIFGWMEGALTNLCILWALYFWCYVPMNAVASFIFDKPQRAFGAMLSWNMLASMVLMIIVNTLKVYKPVLADGIEEVLYMFIPTLALASGVFTILMHNLLPDDQSDALIPDYLSDSCSLMLLSGAMFWFILTLIQSRAFSTRFHKLSCQLFHQKSYTRIRNQEVEDEAQEDADVRNERERLDRHPNREFALAVRNLTRYYDKLAAVRNLTFCVKKEECFGLLGVNGAGKTTTFDILTGVRFASSGTATIEGVNVNRAPAIGYCPQFDALPMELTGREVLTLLARLNGFSDVKARVDRILWCLKMEDKADKMIMQYSGGQKRRISIGTTLVTRSSLIMLDEPTAGIDPITRRQIWQLLQAIRGQGIAILLTSHSMDECEELCNKIGFMNKGTLIGIGSSQHLKSRFGNSYLLAITISNPTATVFEKLNSIVVEAFDTKPTEDLSTATCLHWEIPKREHVTWSMLYKKAQELADSYPHNANLPPDSDQPQIEDFSLTQNSLEQVFLRLSKSGLEAKTDK